ncbi:hypothetical protein F1D05_05820 [Kribbella qitaiheensis]|uniref:Uncharacterized protein n=1 Tax=Kribbella qitaiheensis TaxID=1544730 RepID=A0A7G6WU46_9ACTN|nr:hypothetical protein [Kribbella qitaiheensis]QNE17511.1 hypothetical protein F1D05_05820 [Kribbella qitaiheensis]
MDEVKKLLTQFADQSVDGLPPADVDADVARGRRALFRIRARRRTTGVLCIAAVSTAVFAFGNQLKWWGGADKEVATGGSAAAGASATPSTPTPSQAEETISTFSSPALELVANTKPWSSVACTLVPQGWTPQTPIATDRAVLTPPSVRTSDEDAKLVLRSAADAQTLLSVRVTQAGGKFFHIGTVAGREVGQVKLGERWLVVQLPTQHPEWDDASLQRFMASCSLS